MAACSVILVFHSVVHLSCRVSLHAKLHAWALNVRYIDSISKIKLHLITRNVHQRTWFLSDLTNESKLSDTSIHSLFLSSSFIYSFTLNLMARFFICQSLTDQVMTVESTISNLSCERAKEQCQVPCARMWTCVTSTSRLLKLEMWPKLMLNLFLNQRRNENVRRSVITSVCWLTERTRLIKSHSQTRTQDTYRSYSDFWEEYQMTDHDTLGRRHQEVTL